MCIHSEPFSSFFPVAVLAPEMFISSPDVSRVGHIRLVVVFFTTIVLFFKTFALVVNADELKT